MSDEIVYTLTELSNSIVDESIETMEDWLNSISNDVFNEFHRICSKSLDDRTEEDSYEICKHALILYCREIDITELSINTDLLNNISNGFCTNIIFKSLIINGMAKSTGPLLLYKDCSIELTEKGRDFIKKEVKKKK